MAVWITVGFFEEIKNARVDVGGVVYQNSFQCIPSSLPVPPTATGALLGPHMPLGVAISPGPLLVRLENAMRHGELLPYLEVRPPSGAARDVLRLNRLRVTGVLPMATKHTREVTIIQE